MNKIVSFVSVLSLFAALGCSSESVDPIYGTGGTVEVSNDGGHFNGSLDGTGGASEVVADFVSGGLGEYGSWKGYLFTAVDDFGSTITPSEFTGSDICVSGTVTQNDDWKSWAMVGWNIAQDVDPVTFEGGVVNSIVPDSSGVEVNVVNNSSASLRIQIQSDENGTESWCADLKNGKLLWSDFKKECWGQGGEVYSGTPIAQIAVQVPAGSNTSDTPFDFCVIHLGPSAE